MKNCKRIWQHTLMHKIVQHALSNFFNDYVVAIKERKKNCIHYLKDKKIAKRMKF